MKKSRSIALALAAAMALACAATALAQTQTPSAQGVPGGAGSPTPGTVNPQATDPSTATPSTVSPPAASRQSSPTVDPAERSRSAAGNTRMAAAGHVSAGMPVQSTSGEALGAVRDVVPRPSGDPGYVVITLPAGGKTAVPYATAVSTIRNGTIVLDRIRLEDAPRVEDSQLQNHSDRSWERQADHYWSRGGAPRGPGCPAMHGRARAGPVRGTIRALRQRRKAQIGTPLAFGASNIPC